MIKFKEYVKPKTLEEAYQILTEKNSRVIGGAAFLKLSNQEFDVAIDLIDANLDFINDYPEKIEVGSMVTISAFEEDHKLSTLYNGFLKNVAEKILSYQMRNIVTVGGTIYPKYGFSDLITALLVLNTNVELYKNGKMPLEKFLETKIAKDILSKIEIMKENLKLAFKYVRNSEYDFSLLNVAVSNNEGKFKIAVGARPGIAQLAKNAAEFLSNNAVTKENIEKAAEIASEELKFSDDLRATAEYRKKICKALVKRAIEEVTKWRLV